MITKRLHNHLYGTAGDGGPLGEDEHRYYEQVLHSNAAQLAAAVPPVMLCYCMTRSRPGWRRRCVIGAPA